MRRCSVELSGNEDEFSPSSGPHFVDDDRVPTEEGLDTASEAVLRVSGKDAVRSVQEILDQTDARAAVAGSGVVPEPADLQSNPNFGELIVQVNSIAGRYHSGDIELVVLEQDLVSLASILVSLNAMVGYQDGVALDAEGRYKTSLERMFLRVRQAAMDRGVRMPETVAKAMARDNCEHVREYWWKNQMAASTIKGYYYAARHLAEVLDHMSARLRQERLSTKYE